MTRLLLAIVATLATPVFGQNVLVIAPDAFRPALEDWLAWRRGQGLDVAVEPPARGLRAQVRGIREKSGGKLTHVLLLGDAAKVACDYEKGVVIAPYERDPRIANDNRLADLDGDGLPELAVGRLPADNPAEAAELLARTLAYERKSPRGTWRRRINVVAGVGGFGKLQDWALEQVATKFLRENVPPAYDLHVTYGNPDSAFCPPPASIGQTMLERLNEGALLVAYLGHGSRNRLDRLRYRGESYEILDEDMAYDGIAMRRGAPIVFLCACSTGHFDGAPDCLAEVMLKRPAGPAALIASSRVSMPYANAVVAKELLDAIFCDRAPTLGEALRIAKRRTMEPRPNDRGRAFIETLAMGYKWSAEERAKERAEHLYLYNLLGDPTLRLPHPAPVALACAAQTTPGQRLVVKLSTPVSGRGRVELVADRKPPPVPAGAARAFARTYARANDRVRARVECEAGAGEERALEFVVPRDLEPGAYVVRAWLEGPDGYALGATKLTVRAASKPAR